jgi:hypothetical protein
MHTANRSPAPPSSSVMPDPPKTDETATFALSAVRQSVRRSWRPILQALRDRDLPVTFRYDDADGYWAFVVRRLEKYGLVVAEDRDGAIKLLAVIRPMAEER